MHKAFKCQTLKTNFGITHLIRKSRCTYLPRTALISCDVKTHRSKNNEFQMPSTIVLGEVYETLVFPIAQIDVFIFPTAGIS